MYSCSQFVGLLSVLFVSLFMWLTFSCSYFLINDKMENSILFHGGTKNLTAPTATYKMNDVTQ